MEVKTPRIHTLSLHGRECLVSYLVALQPGKRLQYSLDGKLVLDVRYGLDSTNNITSFAGSRIQVLVLYAQVSTPINSKRYPISKPSSLSEVPLRVTPQ